MGEFIRARCYRHLITVSRHCARSFLLPEIMLTVTVGEDEEITNNTVIYTVR